MRNLLDQRHGEGLMQIVCDCNVCVEAREEGDRQEAEDAADAIIDLIVENGVNREKIAEVLFARYRIPAFDSDERPPIALTDQQIAALTRAIEAEGYTIMVDPETGDVKLERQT